MHFAAGPWFSVVESGAGWQPYGEVWLSDGGSSDRALLEYRVRFADEPWQEAVMR